MSTEEEFQEFVEKNKDIIKRFMMSQREDAKDAADIGKRIADDTGQMMKETALKVRERTEQFVRQTGDLITDPSIQKHFINMGMEFMAGVSEIIEKAPLPGIVKDFASTAERNLKQTACRKNDECTARMAKAEVIDIEAKVE